MKIIISITMKQVKYITVSMKDVQFDIIIFQDYNPAITYTRTLCPKFTINKPEEKWNEKLNVIIDETMLHI